MLSFQGIHIGHGICCGPGIFNGHDSLSVNGIFIGTGIFCGNLICSVHGF